MKLQIAKVRKEKGMTQDELAHAIGLSRPYLAQIEKGTRKLSADRQKEIADALGVDASTLVDFKAPDEEREQVLLEAFRSMSEEQREVLLQLATVSLSKK